MQKSCSILAWALLVAGCSSSGGGSADGGADGGTGPLIGTEVAVTVRQYAGVPARTGFVSVPYLRGDGKAHLVNIGIDLNGDGAIAPYAAGAAMQEEWVVRNVPLVVSKTRFGHAFAVVDAALAQGHVVRARVSLTSAPVTAPPVLGGTTDMLSSEGTATVAVQDAPLLVQPAMGNVGAGAGSGEPYDQWLNEDPATVEVPGGIYQSGFPAAPQQMNSCVLTSIANALGWLGRRYHFASCLEGMDSAGQMYGTDSTEGIQNLSMQIDSVGMFGYTPEGGVPPAMILPGKNRVVSSMGLPLGTRQISAAPGAPITGAIEDALRQGCAVEVILVGGGIQHMVNAVGFFDGDLGGHYRTLALHNGDTSTSSFSDVYTVDGSSGMDMLTGFPVNGQATSMQIATAMIECPSTTATYPAVVLDYDHGPFKAGQKVDLRCVAGGHVAAPDRCMCPHYHGEGVMITEGMRASGPIPDNNPMMCGHGCVASFDITKLDVVCWKKGP